MHLLACQLACSADTASPAHLIMLDLDTMPTNLPFSSTTGSLRIRFCKSKLRTGSKHGCAGQHVLRLPYCPDADGGLATGFKPGSRLYHDVLTCTTSNPTINYLPFHMGLCFEARPCCSFKMSPPLLSSAVTPSSTQQSHPRAFITASSMCMQADNSHTGMASVGRETCMGYCSLSGAQWQV